MLPAVTLQDQLSPYSGRVKRTPLRMRGVSCDAEKPHSDEMELFPLLLTFFTVSGYKLQPRLSVVQIAEMDTDDVSEQLREVFLSTAGRKTMGRGKLWTELESPEVNPARTTGQHEKITEGGEETKDDPTPETTPAIKSKSETKAEDESHRNAEETLESNDRRSEVISKGDEGQEANGPMEHRAGGATHEAWRTVETVGNHNKIGDEAKTQMKPRTHDGSEQRRQTMVDKERESELVAGIRPHKPERGDEPDLGETPTGAKGILQEKGANPTPESNGDRKPTEPTASRTPSVRPTQPRTSETGTVRSKDKKRTDDVKAQNSSEKKKKKKVVTVETDFPYFKDSYCPPECACYGRVVQCSDKAVDKVPYGIPYAARYILLMNNRIDGIQLDLLGEYASMEFLVLSNNRLTDGAIEGAFHGVLALKRLYLDRNLLESVPADLPASLEEIRLDNNRLRVMSEAAWAQCPGLQVLTLSNNSLGNGSEPLPNAVFSPLHQLRTLNLDHNGLTTVPLGLPLSVKELFLKGNLIQRFHGGVFHGVAELLVLDLSENRLVDAGLSRDSFVNATRLESVNLEGNRLKLVPRHLPVSLKMLNLEGNLLTSIRKASFSALKNLEHLGLARNKILKVAPGAFRTLSVLHQLDLCHNALHQVPRQLPAGLHSVALAHNKIGSVPRDAFCWGNGSLSLSGLVRVRLDHNVIDMGRLDVKAFRCLRGFQVVHFY